MNDKIVRLLEKALWNYVRLDNARRAGCIIEDEDWAECHSLAMDALRKAHEAREEA